MKSDISKMEKPKEKGNALNYLPLEGFILREENDSFQEKIEKDLIILLSQLPSHHYTSFNQGIINQGITYSKGAIYPKGIKESYQPEGLERIIDFSCGIGRSIEEAELASKEAKKRKNEGRLINICIYQGDPLNNKPELPSNEEDYFRVMDHLIDNNAPESVIQSLENLTKDPQTGLLNRIGYRVQKRKMGKTGEDKETYFIYLDGNEMKRHNDMWGQTEVDSYLAAAGRAISSSLRLSPDRRDKREYINHDRREMPDRRNNPLYRDEIIEDCIPVRKNGFGGDELTIEVHLEPSEKNLEIVVGIAERLMQKMYEAQYELAGYKCFFGSAN